MVIQRWLLPAGVDDSGRQEVEITSSGFGFEWQQPVAGDLVKLLIWAYVINRRALAPMSKADGLLVWHFPPGPEAAPVTVHRGNPAWPLRSRAPLARVCVFDLTLGGLGRDL